MIETVTDTFNKCLINGEDPSKEWKKAYLTSIYRKGSKKGCLNNHGTNVQ